MELESSEIDEPALSIVIAAYNERATLPSILRQAMLALPGITRQIVIVDDSSTDGTRQWLEENFGSMPRQVAAIAGSAAAPQFPDRKSGSAEAVAGPCEIAVIYRRANGGKGAALRDGFAAARGRIIVIQDADLEYDPTDWTEMYGLIATDRADVVFGSRFYGRPHRVLYFYHLLGNKLITYLFNLLFNVTLSDLETCYKMFRRAVIDGIVFRCEDFGIEVELAAAIAAPRRWRVYEMGISYFGRTYAEGKKVNWRDGLKALWYVVKFRLTPPRPLPRDVQPL